MITLLPTSEQIAIVDVTGSFLDKVLPLGRLHRQHNRRTDANCWTEFAELGWFSLGVPEAEDGVGLDLPTRVLVFRRLGRNLVTPSVLASALAGEMAAGDATADVRHRLMEGKARAAFLIPSIGLADSGERSSLLVDGEGANFAINWTESSLSLLNIAPLKERRRISSFDPALTLERCTLDEAATVIATSDRGALASADLLLASLAVGVADAALDMAVSYAQTREQFGRPIGSFQAIKHRCADMAVATEVAWAQTALAALQHAAGCGKDAGPTAARILASEAAIANSEANIQIHGGIGFTDDADPHLLVRRAQMLARLGGDRRIHRSAMLAHFSVTQS